MFHISARVALELSNSPCRNAADEIQLLQNKSPSCSPAATATQLN